MRDILAYSSIKLTFVITCTTFMDLLIKAYIRIVIYPLSVASEIKFKLLAGNLVSRLF